MFSDCRLPVGECTQWNFICKILAYFYCTRGGDFWTIAMSWLKNGNPHKKPELISRVGGSRLDTELLGFKQDWILDKPRIYQVQSVFRTHEYCYTSRIATIISRDVHISPQTLTISNYRENKQRKCRLKSWVFPTFFQEVKLHAKQQPKIKLNDSILYNKIHYNTKTTDHKPLHPSIP